jgi:dihydrodipicolinate synthase/N-acetylneuraminate lyase
VHFEGVIPAALTPFDANDEVDVDALGATAGGLLDDGATGLVATGTMGEAQSLSRSERRLVIETLVAGADGRVTVTAGVSSETPSTSIAYAEDAAAAGAGALMLLPSLGYSGDAREIEAFYRAVAESTDLPIMAYNNPKASGTDMPPALVARLAAIDGVVAIKECSGDARRLAELLNITDGFEVLVGGDDWALEGFCAGATGWVSGVANIAPRECADLLRLCREGSLDDARAIYARILPLARLDMRPKLVQYFKAAMDLTGRRGGPCRPPRLELNEGEQREVKEAVAALGAGVAA